jgi:hypothetical protein
LAAAARKLSFATRMQALLVALAVFAGALAVAPAPAMAQSNKESSPWTIRELFAPRKGKRLEPPAKVERAQKVRPKTKSVKIPAKSRKVAKPQVQVVDKNLDSQVVLVIGDFMSGGLAEGLETAFLENGNIRIVDRSNGSSGFVRDDYYDWPLRLTELLEYEKPDAVVVMIGANDRQLMRIGQQREQPLNEKWTAEYKARASHLAKTVADAKIPLLWVGVPAFKSPKMTSDMLAFNDIYRAATQAVGGTYVDIWDAFVDENGAFTILGPDINGQPVRLRSNDGINFTAPGKRKMAFYVEKPLIKFLGDKSSGKIVFAPIGLPDAAIPPVDVSLINRTVPVSLADPILDGGNDLLGFDVTQKFDARSPGEKMVVEGIGPDPLPGRADDFAIAPPPPVPVVLAAPAVAPAAIPAEPVSLSARPDAVQPAPVPNPAVAPVPAKIPAISEQPAVAAEPPASAPDAIKAPAAAVPVAIAPGRIEAPAVAPSAVEAPAAVPAVAPVVTQVPAVTPAVAPVESPSGVKAEPVVAPEAPLAVPVIQSKSPEAPEKPEVTVEPVAAPVAAVEKPIVEAAPVAVAAPVTVEPQLPAAVPAQAAVPPKAAVPAPAVEPAATEVPAAEPTEAEAPVPPVEAETDATPSVAPVAVANPASETSSIIRR